MQAALAKPTLGDLKHGAKVIDTFLEDPDREVVMKPIPLDNLVLVGFGDASYGQRPVESQVVLATTPEFLESKEVAVSLLDWKNHKIGAATGSTRSSETTSVFRCAELAQSLEIKSLFLSVKM